MRLQTRKLLDRSFTGLGFFSILIMAAALIILLAPIFVKGAGAFYFKGTVEFRKMQAEKFGRGGGAKLTEELRQARQARAPVYDYLNKYEAELDEMSWAERAKAKKQFEEVEDAVTDLLGPGPEETTARQLPRDQYGPTRWDRAQVKARELLYYKTYEPSPDPTKMSIEVEKPRAELFKDTSLEGLFPYVRGHLEEMLHPRPTFYWRFLFDKPIDSYFFGGIWPALLGTFYLTLGSMLIAFPMGVIAAIYFVEYTGNSRLVALLRTCVSTLAGVPSIVFGLFGLAFFINTIHVSDSKSVLAGSLTLALLVLPTVIRASEEAIRTVPNTYREAALGLGAGKWRTITTVILPASLSGILTGTIISMGRAAGETAPIIFTAAVSMGKPLKITETFSEGTQALSWNIYNLATEHEAVEEIRHMQYGMALTLVALVLLLNLAAILLRARINKKLRG